MSIITYTSLLFNAETKLTMFEYMIHCIVQERAQPCE